MTQGGHEGHRHDGGAHESDGPGSIGQRLNWLRAGVLGANDGIVSVAGIVIGVAGATDDRSTILVSGLAGLVAGALSMAGGEYASVSTQRDTESTLVETERRVLAEHPAEAESALAASLQERGLSETTARDAARELSAGDPLRAHAAVEYGLDPDELTNPWQAAISSFLSFTLGALLPLLAITLLPEGVRVIGCAVAVVAALALTGWSSAALGRAPRVRATVRVMGVGAATMAVTYGLGTAFGVATA
ncbi:VIT family protein [Glycomyces sp. TRM65418]|uniref:VIT1/CCC1 transporter family protein n=1 Tax=Glycomyces sp. TRM65418 TaxID=2867006 RepID=UPI001CE5FBF3|nr:VIT family protein [Glycomyces sp. TRM65418]MCC3765390.1 VIT family protein [Glycomyces sp. TRM65418]QZD57941.1 VIT family protein [Glycomyces sp. TRM65418]